MSLIDLVTQAVCQPSETTPVVAQAPKTAPQTVDVGNLRRRASTAIRSRQRSSMETAREAIGTAIRDTRDNNIRLELSRVVAELNEGIIKFEINEAGKAISAFDIWQLIAARRKLLAMLNDRMFSQHRETLSYAIGNLNVQMNKFNEQVVVGIMLKLEELVLQITQTRNALQPHHSEKLSAHEMQRAQDWHDRRLLSACEILFSQIIAIRSRLAEDKNIACALSRLWSDEKFRLKFDPIDDEIVDLSSLHMPQLRSKVAAIQAAEQAAVDCKRAKKQRHLQNRAIKAEEHRKRGGSKSTKSKKG